MEDAQVAASSYPDDIQQYMALQAVAELCIKAMGEVALIEGDPETSPRFSYTELFNHYIQNTINSDLRTEVLHLAQELACHPDLAGPPNIEILSINR